MLEVNIFITFQLNPYFFPEQRSKRKRIEEAPPKESAREKKRSEKVTSCSLLHFGSGPWLVQLLGGLADVR